VEESQRLDQGLDCDGRFVFEHGLAGARIPMNRWGRQMPPGSKKQTLLQARSDTKTDPKRIHREMATKEIHRLTV
jgi:hypothetical protein